MRRLVLLRAKVHDDDEGHHGKHHQHQRAARRVLLLAFTAVQAAGLQPRHGLQLVGAAADFARMPVHTYICARAVSTRR